MCLTKRQEEALIAIIEFTTDHKYPPTVRELRDMMGHSTPSATFQMLKLLENKGYIKREPNKPRTIICKSIY